MSIVIDVPVLTFTRAIAAPAAQVYKSFTEGDWVKDWFCDHAHLDPRVGGYALFAWHTNYYAQGMFTELEPDKKIALTWRGAGESSDTLIEIMLEETTDQTEMSLTLRDFNPEAEEILIREWEPRLDNLKSVLEAGADLRITDRAIMGIFWDEFDEETARKLGVPVTDGVRISNVIENLGAAAAGLQPDDVVVSLNGHTVTRDTALGALVTNKKPGDEIEVVFYRKDQKRTVKPKLAGYPIPELPVDFRELGDQAEKIYADLDAELSALLAGLSEEQASQRPDPDEWNVKEILAHLILDEQYIQNWLGGLMQGPEISGYTCNTPARIAGVTATHPTLADILKEMRRSWAETTALLRHVPARFMERKTFLWRANFQLHGSIPHRRLHLGQIRNTISAVGG